MEVRERGRGNGREGMRGEGEGGEMGGRERRGDGREE